MDTIEDAAATLSMNLSAGPSVPIAAWMGGRYAAEPVGATEALDHCSTCKTVWPVSLLTYDGQEEWHCAGCAPAKPEIFRNVHSASAGYDRGIARAYFLLDSYVDLLLRGQITPDQLRIHADKIRSELD